jgi:DNA-binding transcriptional MocR family regulator
LKTYEQIVEDLESRIRTGAFRARERLPSVRELCDTFRCSKSTAVKAYDILKNKHLVYSVPQSGSYIVENYLQAEQTNPLIIDFSTGTPPIGDMYVPDLKHCLDRAVDIFSGYDAACHDLYGVDSLRNLLPKYLADFQVFTTPNNIFVNLGIQQALNILTQMPFPNHKDAILIEQPTYGYYTDFLKFSGVRVLGIRRGQNGIDLNQLEYLFKNEKIKFFYTVPRNHNPLGTSYPKAQRKAIAQLAEKYDVYIVEDDYFSDISFDNQYDPIFAYGDHYHHIYLKNFIKVIPWIRIGIIVVPTNLLPIFTQYVRFSYYYSYFSASPVSQATLEIYIRSNLLKKHVTSIKKELSSRLKCLKQHFKDIEQYGVECIGGHSGIYCYLKLPEHIHETQFVENLKKGNILVTPGKTYYIDDRYYEKGIRISIARTSIYDIDKGLPVISSELSKQSR